MKYRAFTTFLALATHLAIAAEPQVDAPMDAQSIETRRFDAMRELPAGEGKELTAVACSRCHDLGGLHAYKGYWTRAQWLAMVESMVKNGAVLDTAGVQVVTDYLTLSYGRPSSP